MLSAPAAVAEPETELAERERLPAIPASRPPAPDGPPATSHRHEILKMLQTTFVFLVGALFVLTFIVQPYRIPTGSMENTLQVGDFMLVNKAIFANPGPWGRLLPYEPVRRDDIVVFHYPVDHSMYLVKRTIAAPGDHVHLQNGHVILDGRRQKEPFALYMASYPSAYRDNFPIAAADPSVTPRWRSQMKRDVHDGELTVPAGEYFVMGDNRNDSLDSRYWGFVPRQNIVGEPFLIYFSVVSQDNPEMARQADDRLPEGHGWWASLAGSIRWYRIFHVIH
jgi:signal peptidase I